MCPANGINRIVLSELPLDADVNEALSVENIVKEEAEDPRKDEPTEKSE